ncbi:MAG TPA: hypothetical protein VNA25_25915, partial [Phycisphaerae bacterium]|nr:hypothetical protein [Phycisphaerae bacterium]
MADIKYTVVVDSAGATSSVQRFDQALKDTEKTTERAEGGFGKLWKQMAVGQIVGQAVTQIFRAITREMMSVVTAAEAQESADNALASALELTGRAIPLSQMKEFASQMQAMTRFGDEEVQSAQTLLVQMTNLDKDGLERATKGAIGLASVMRMDLFSATSLVQKALSGNIGALSRYGISVDATLTKDEQRAQLMDKLSVLFGRAEAETDTFAVKITQLKNAYGDMKESIGAAIINNQAFKDLIQGITEKIQTLITSGKLDEWATKISAAITVAIKTLESFFDLVDNLSKGKSIGQTVADQIFGVKGDIAARTADA